MEVPLVSLAARMTRWAVGGRRYHPFVSFYTLRWAATMRRSASAVCNLVAMLVKTPVRPMWSCADGLGGIGRLVSVQRQNQTRAHLPAQRESGAAVTHGDSTETAWMNSKTLLKLSVVLANVSVLACFVLPIFIVFLSSASTPPALSSSSSLSSFSPPESSPFSILSVTK